MSVIKFDELIGKVFTSVKGKRQDNEFILENDDLIVSVYVEEDCCNNGWLEDIDGDINDLLNTPIITFEEVGSRTKEVNYYGADNNYQDRCTWTYYKIETQQGGVTLRFVGTSNGYYCEQADVHITGKNTEL